MARKLLAMIALTNTVTASAEIVDKKELSSTVVVNGDEIVGYDGKPKKFKNFDDFIRSVIDQNPFAETVTLEVNTLGVKTPKLPADPVAAAEGDVAKYTKLKTRATAASVKLADDISKVAAWENNPIPTYAQGYADMVARKAAIDAQVTYFDTVIAAANTIINAGN